MAHFVWFIIVIRGSRLIDSVALVLPKPVIPKPHASTTAHCISIRDSTLTVHGLLKPFPVSLEPVTNSIHRTRILLGNEEEHSLKFKSTKHLNEPVCEWNFCLTSRSKDGFPATFPQMGQPRTSSYAWY